MTELRTAAFLLNLVIIGCATSSIPSAFEFDTATGQRQILSLDELDDRARDFV